MYDSLRYYASVAASFAKLSVQRQLEYPLFLVSWLLMIPIQYFSGIWMLKVLVDRFQPLAGWEFPQIAFLYGLGLLSHGLQVVFFIQTWNLDFMITQGEFDRLLVRPMNLFFQFCVRNINFIGLIDLIPGIIIFAHGCREIQFQWTPGNILKLFAVIAGAVLLRAAFYTCLSSVAFWTYRSRPLVHTGLALIERTSYYPMTIYPFWCQMLFTFIIPLAFISFYPACDFVGQGDNTQLPLDFAMWTPLVGLLCFAIAQIVFKIGLKQYESAGS